MIEIMNLRKDQPEEMYDCRIDRGWSSLANPFKMDTEVEREVIITKYAKHFKHKVAVKDSWIMTELETMIALYKQCGKLRLFCWCSPKPCHGDIIKAYILKSVGEEEKPMFDNTQGMEKELPPVTGVVKRGRGRPKGSKNKQKTVPPEPPIPAPEDNTREE